MVKNKSKQIVVGVSGGVDSTIALNLLKEQGWSPIAVYLKLPSWQKKDDTQNIKKIKLNCKKLNVPVKLISVSQSFKRIVVKHFLDELKSGNTPNPCVFCNRHFKFQYLFDFAKKNNIKFVATGHYAKIKQNTKTKKFELHTAKDITKDQTYYLSLLKNSWLKHVIFPLGNITKAEVYALAKKYGYTYLLKKPQSQDFCYLQNSNLTDFLSQKFKTKSGDIIDQKNTILGQHIGLFNYTLGQRKGLNLPDGPWFVVKKDGKTNSLVVSKKEKDLLSKTIIIKNPNFVSGHKITKATKVTAKIRYQQELVSAVLKPLSKTTFEVNFSKPVRAITPGQYCVFYKNKVCLGQGVIK